MEETGQETGKETAKANPVYIYGGFWRRTAAAIIDSILMLMILVPVLGAIYGAEYWDGGSLFTQGFWDFVFNYVFPAVVVILFWVYKSATPGKMLLKLRIVDALTGSKASTGQLIGRYFAYYVSAIPLLLGFLWVGFDRRKQGWHDKLAGTLVIVDQGQQQESQQKPRSKNPMIIEK